MTFNQALHAFHFMRPLWLLALPLLWSLTIWLARSRARDGDWTRLIDADLLPGLRLEPPAGVGGSTPWPWLMAAWTCAVLALAGPSWAHDSTAAYRAPAAWMMVLDLSPSMATSDLSPNRATRARYAMNDVLDGARDTRVGLVAFSDEAYTIAPLTDDVATVRALLPPLAPDIMPSAGDSLAPALERGATLLQQSGSKDRQMIVFSDGFDDPASALRVAARLKVEGVTVNVVGIGTTSGAPLQDANGGFERDANGQPRLARMDQDGLRQIATAGGGRYVDLAQLPALISAISAQGDPATEATAEKGVVLAHWLDGGVWLLPGLLLLAALLARRGWL